MKRILPYFYGSAFCGAILLAVFAFKGIWPFGTGNVTYDDMAQAVLPYYYHLYDWMHGEKALFWDWFSGLGVNIANSGNATPIDFLILFFKRSNLIYALGILVIARCMAAAFTARISFQKMFPKVNSVWKTLFSISYALSAYSMFYYTNLQWLDFVILFPLILCGLKQLLDGKKPWLYIVSYAVALVLSVYLGFMVTLALLFIGGLYALLVLSKEHRTQRVFLFGASTVAGILLSGWHSLPTALQTLSSKRLASSFDNTPNQNPIITIMENTKLASMPQKASLFIGMQLAAVLLLFLIFKLFKDKKFKGAFFVLGSTLIMVLPVIMENSNLIWHGGSYVSFPMRFAFTSIFLVLCFGLYFLENYSSSLVPCESKSAQILLKIILFVFSTGFLYALYFMAANRGGTMNNTALIDIVVFICVVALFGLGIPMFIVALRMEKHLMRTFCFLICSIQCFAVAYSGIANSFNRQKQDMLYNSDSFVEYCNEVESLDTQSGALGRIKNKDTSLNANYPFLIKAQALSNWTHNIPAYMQQAAFNLGYSKQYTRLLDSGGTAFTDSILGVNKLIVRSDVPVSAQYSLIDKTENFSLYKNNYSVEFGLLAGGELLTSITQAQAKNRFEIQNWLYSMFTNDTSDLISFCGTDGDKSDSIEIKENTDKEIVFEYTAGKNEVLYLNATDFGKQTMKIFVNNERVLAPYYKHTTYGYYPSSAVNGILELGSFSEGETVEIVARCINENTLSGKTVQLGCMSLDKVEKLNTLSAGVVTDEKVGKTSLSFNYNNPTGEEKYVFIPVSYDDGWSCSVNGKPADVCQALGAYLSVKLPAGSGTVEMHYRVKGTFAGIGFTLIGIIAAATIFLILKRKGRVPNFIAKPVFAVFAAIISAAIAATYIVPLGFIIKKVIISLVK